MSAPGTTESLGREVSVGKLPFGLSGQAPELPQFSFRPIVDKDQNAWRGPALQGDPNLGITRWLFNTKYAGFQEISVQPAIAINEPAY
jgi:hypothetical protein